MHPQTIQEKEFFLAYMESGPWNGFEDLVTKRYAKSNKVEGMIMSSAYNVRQGEGKDARSGSL